MNRYFIIHASFYLILLSGCVTEFVRHTPNKTKIVQFKPKAVNHNQSRLAAAERFVKSGDISAAKSYVDTISPVSLSVQQRNRLNLVQAQIHLSNGETEQALNKLSITQPYHLKQDEKIAYYQSLAFAHSLNGELIKAVKARIQLSSLLETFEEKNENNIVIINTLNLLSDETLFNDQPPAPDTLAGWMALTRLIKEGKKNQNHQELQINLNQWKLFFPEHPANSEFLNTFFVNSTENFELPAAIAILLPESGRFSQAAEIIKEGFMEAYHQSEPTFKPSIRFYDSATYDIATLYHQAISEGAELVIGPLSKENIQVLASNTRLKVPVLALNHIPNLVVDNLFQFGLSPIDEAEQVANLAAMDGNKNALVLVPKSNQGDRIATYLAESWEQTGGRLLESQFYNPRGSNFSTPVVKLLNLDESRNRYNRLKKLLAKNISFVERRRQDVDVILLSATAKKARSLYPQIRFFHASRVPVYAMPNIYTGLPNPALDLDLDNITFCGIPWLFDDSYSSESNQKSGANSWQNIPSRHLRLIALGLDAFNLIPYLDQISSEPYPGATGQLSVNLNNRITRQLACAKFVNGSPVLQYFNDL